MATVFLQSNWLIVSPYNMIQTTFSNFAESHSFFKFPFWHRTLSKIDEILILFSTHSFTLLAQKNTFTFEWKSSQMRRNNRL